MPFIVHYPAGIAAGTRSDLLINNTDFAPTLIEAAGGTAPGYMQGYSFADHLDGSKPDGWRDATYYRYWMHLTHHDVPAHFGLRTDRYKLIYYYAQPYREADIGRGSMWWKEESYPIRPTPVAWEFYDLVKDPYESQNRYGEADYRDTIERLKLRLRQLRIQYGETDTDPRLTDVIEANWE
jgi:uncharacterized sulfatase